MNISFKEDKLRAGVDSLPDWVQSEIEAKELTDSHGNVSFCGLMANDSGLLIFLPRNSPVPSSVNDQLAAAVLTTSTVERYTSEKNRVRSGGISEEIEGGKLLTLAREILDDYRVNGLYVRIQRRRTINTGKIDWKNTINKQTPFLDRNGAPVYIRLEGKKNSYSVDSEVARIHKAVVCKLDKSFGWWITKKENGRVAPDISADKKLLSEKRYCISILKRELTDCYAERDIRLINNLISYIESIPENDAEESPVVVGAKNFHHIWEHMLDKILDKTVELNNKIPEPVYFKPDGLPLAGGARKKMRMDAVLEDSQSGKVVIVDAKYYGAFSSEDLPGWSDLVKQFFYAKAIKLIRPKASVTNVFIFPGMSGFVSVAKVKDALADVYYDTEFLPVHCHYINPISVMRDYVGRKKNRQLTDKLFKK